MKDSTASRRTFLQGAVSIGGVTAIGGGGSLFAAEGSATQIPSGVNPELWKLVPADLRYVRQPLPNDRNAWPLWKAAFEEFEEQHRPFDFLDGDKPYPEGAEGKRLDLWIEANRKANETFDRGTIRGLLQFPLAASLAEFAETDNYMGLRSIQLLKSTIARKLISQQKFEEAARVLAAMFVADDLAARGEGFLIHSLIASAVSRMTFQTVQAISQNKAAPIQAIGFLLKELSLRPPNLDTVRQMIRTELCHFVLPALSRMPEGGRLSPLLDAFLINFDSIENDLRATRRLRFALLLNDHSSPFDKTDTADLLVGIYRRMLKNVDNTWPDRERRLTSAEFLEEHNWPKALQSLEEYSLDNDTLNFRQRREVREELNKLENPLGKLLAVQHNGFEIRQHYTMFEAHWSATRAVLAIRLFESASGRLPNQLAELVEAKLLDNVPIDPFSDKPLRYSARDRLLWSVGPDGAQKDVPTSPRPDEFLPLQWRVGAE